MYRIHDKQLTWKGGEKGGSYWNKYRNDLIDKYIQTDELNTVFTTPS